MKAVIQLDTTGCAIASVAALAKVSYAKAKSAAKALGIYADDPALWSETGHLRKLLAHFGLVGSPTEIPFRSWTSLPDLALLSIKWHLETGRPCWHWVVFARENGAAFVLDSKKKLRNHRRTDFGRMKPKWFIPITEIGGRAGRRRIKHGAS